MKIDRLAFLIKNINIQYYWTWLLALKVINIRFFQTWLCEVGNTKIHLYPIWLLKSKNNLTRRSGPTWFYKTWLPKVYNINVQFYQTSLLSSKQFYQTWFLNLKNIIRFCWILLLKVKITNIWHGYLLNIIIFSKWTIPTIQIQFYHTYVATQIERLNHNFS